MPFVWEPLKLNDFFLLIGLAFVSSLAQITAIAGEDWASGDYGTELLFKTVTDTNASVSEVMRIANSGLIIGGTSGTGPLTVWANSGASNTRLVGRNNGSTDEAELIFTHNDGITAHGNITGMNTELVLTGGTTQAMWIKSNGDIGVGNDDPDPFSWGTHSFTVWEEGATNSSPNIDIVATGTGTAALIFGGGTSTGTDASIRRAQISSTDGSHLHFGTNSNDTSGSGMGGSIVDRMKIEQDGGVFMYNLLAASASTDVNINGSDELHSVTSSGVYKEDYSLGTGSDRVLNLQPRTFTWRHPIDAPDGWAQQVGDPGRRDFGLIAEEVAEVMPELVNYKDGQPYSVRYQMMSVLLLEQLQELKKEIEDLKNAA